MFYIDFNSPEGRSYRIDVLKNPIYFECPVCREVTQLTFEPTENYCYFCYSRQKENNLRLLKMANHLNKKYDLNLAENDLEELENNPEYKRNPEQALEDFIDTQVEKRIKEKRLNGEIHPKVSVIHKGKVL